MTAEILVMNKNGIAMAADSIVTLTTSNNTQKTFNTANKLFSLSKIHPVAAMVSQNVFLLEYPWEIITKQFRKSLEKTEFPTLEDYLAKFLAFIGMYFTNEEQSKFVDNIVKVALNAISNHFRDELNKNPELDDQATEELFLFVISNFESQIESYDNYLNLSDDFFRICEETYREIIIDSIKEIFPQITTNDEKIYRLFKICTKFLSKDFFTPNNISEYTTLVIAGYGSFDKFPKYIGLRIFGVIGGYVLTNHYKKNEVTHESPSCVAAFAQRDVVKTYMEGINPDIENVYNGFIESSITSIFNELKNKIPIHILDTNFLSEMDQAAEKIINIGKERVAKEKRSLIDPFLQALNVLPKDELSMIAENLVNLTSIRRKMSTEIETVGGPIDVLVISKGDGLVWIKRKLYFPPELNHQYFQRYNKC